MRRIPVSVMEAAQIDGAGEWQIFRRICMPLCKGCMCSIAILLFIDYWNMVEQPMVFLQDRRKYPLTLLLAELGRAETQKVFVYTLISLLPIMIVYVGLRNYLISGIEASCIRE